MNRIYLLLLLLVFSVMTQAQDDSSGFEKKKVNKIIQIDLSGGVNFDLTHRTEENRMTTLTDRKKVIPALDMRLLHFPSPKWGWYFNLQLKMTGKQIRNCYQEMCQPFETNYYIKNNAPYRNSNLDKTTINVNTGVTYRIENKRWAFYPRLGIGISNYTCQTIDIELKGKGNNELYSINTSLPDLYDNYVNIFIATLGVSANYKFSKRCHLFLDMAYVQPLESVHVNDTKTNLYTELSKRQTHKSSTLGRDFTISMGLGFPIYLNRNKKAALKKTTQRERMKMIMEHKQKAFGLFPGNK